MSAFTSASVSIKRSLDASMVPFILPFIINGFENFMLPVKEMSCAITVSKSSSSVSKSMEFKSLIAAFYSENCGASIGGKIENVPNGCFFLRFFNISCVFIGFHLNKLEKANILR
jgi:hypothetical protein